MRKKGNLRCAEGVHIPAYPDRRLCIYPSTLVHILRIPAHRIPGPALSKLEKTVAIRGDPLEWVLESVLFLIILDYRAICTICAAHVLHIALSNKLIKKITNPGVALPPPGGDTGMSKEREPCRAGPGSRQVVYALYAKAWKGIGKTGGPDRPV